MSSNNSRWELWAAITVNASSAVTEARAVVSQTGKFRQSLGATGVSRAADGVWLVHLRPPDGLSAIDCFMTVTPRYTQYTSADIVDTMSGAVTMTANNDSQFRKRISIMVMKRTASGAGTSYAIPTRGNIPFTLCVYRRTE